MVTLKDVALELLEYKVKDLLANRPFSGGLPSVLELDNYLKQQTLSSTQKTRFDRVTRALERQASGQDALKSPTYSHLIKDKKEERKDEQENSDKAINNFAKAASSAFDNFGSLILGSDKNLDQSEQANERTNQDITSSFDVNLAFGEASNQETTNELIPSGKPTSNTFTNIITKTSSQDQSGKQATNPEKVIPEPILSPLSEVEQKELVILQRLAQKVWWSDLRDTFQFLANAYKGESSRRTVRLLYGLLRNLELYSKNSVFAQDVDMKSFKVIEAIPDYDHPFLPLNNVEGISELLLSVVEAMLTFKAQNSAYKTLNIPQDKILPYFKRMALKIAKDPYAGELSIMARKGLNSEQIQLLLSELERENIGLSAKETEKEKLELLLKEALQFEEAQKDLFKKDTLAYVAVTNNVFDIFATYLPKQLGGKANTPRLQSKVLFGEIPTLSLSTLPKDAKALIVNLKGSTRFKLAGLDFAVIFAGDKHNFYADGLELPLNPYLNLKLRDKKIETFLEEDYLHVRVKDDFRTFTELIAEGLTIQFILEPRHRNATTTILESLTGIAADASVKAASKAVQKLIEFCRHSSNPKETLFKLLKTAAQIYTPNVAEKIIKGLGQYVHFNMTALGTPLFALIEKYHISKNQVTIHPLDKASDKTAISLQFKSTHLNVRKRNFQTNVAYQAVRLNTKANVSLSQTLEEDREIEGMIVTAPNSPPLAFSDYMIYPLSHGQVLLVTSKKELAAIYLPS